jgi:Eukaryotic protein of unknown function (DUF842)
MNGAWLYLVVHLTSISCTFHLQEIGQYQNRLERAIHECAESTRDKMKIGFESDAKLMAKFEDNYVSCIHHTVNEYIGKLKPIKERIIAQLK